MELRNDLHNWTKLLFNYYKNYYIKKEKMVIPFELKPHLQNLHHIYRNNYMKQKLAVNMKVVINYVNNLHPAKLMFSINYCSRK